MSRNVFTRYLAWLRKQLPVRKNGNIYLVVDQYPCHIFDGVESIANSYKITLIPVPKGGTTKYQPLDRLIYGELKVFGKSEWEEKFIGIESPTPRKETVLDLLILCWNKINPAHVRTAWDFENL